MNCNRPASDAEGQVAALEQALADELGREGHEQHEAVEDDQHDRREDAREAGPLGHQLRKPRIAPDVRIHRTRHFLPPMDKQRTNRFASTLLCRPARLPRAVSSERMIYHP